MTENEKFFDLKMIGNVIIALILLVCGMYYFKYADKIEDEVTNVIVSSLKDVNNSLAEQESVKK
jgi:hypothetical protein